ncbi:MAG: efflux RND transporter periplasmic adaptor subunit [Planctomycetota bacterium]
MSQVDLDALKIERAAEARPPRGPRLLWIGLLVAAIFVAGTFLYPVVRPVRVVKTAAVRTAGTQAASTVGVAEAAGWIEPEPFPVHVRPLVGGVLQELLVLEGDAVRKGETVLARLASAELMARHDRAQADLALREAELKQTKVALRVAGDVLAQRGELRLTATGHQHEVIRDEAIAKRAERDLAAAVAQRDAALAELEGQKRLLDGGASYPVALAKAKANVRAAEAIVESRRIEVNRFRDELVVSRTLLSIARELERDPRGLQGEVDRLDAESARRTQAVARARTEAKIAERELAWCEIKAPMDGVVLALEAAPGEAVGPGGKSVVSLYDPKRLQARIDVPLALLGTVRVGQEVEIRSEAAPGHVTRGTVLRMQRESDLLKNTTQVKVRLQEPSPLLVPETLCRARFLGGTRKEETGPTLFRVPRPAVRGDVVFVLDPTGGGRARRVGVEVVGDIEGDVVVRGDLSVTQTVILDVVADGDRVKGDGR